MMLSPRAVFVKIIIIIVSYALFVVGYSVANDKLDLSAMFILNGEYRKACQLIDAVKDNEKTDRYYRQKLLAEYLSANFKHALKTFDQLMQKKWQDYLLAGLICESLGMPDAAKSKYHKSLKKKENSIALYRLGKIAYNAERYMDATRYFKKLADSDSSYRLAYIYIARSNIRLGEKEVAYKYLTKAINFYPNNITLKTELKDIKALLGADFFKKKKASAEETRTKVKLSPYQFYDSSRTARVGLAVKVDSISFRCGTDFYARNNSQKIKCSKRHIYTFKVKDDRLVLIDYNTKKEYARFTNNPELYVTAERSNGKEYKYPFYVFDINYGKGEFWHKKLDRAYRGSLKILRVGNKLTLINLIGVEEYLMGVLSAEIPAHSKMAALKAQAIAARTIAGKFINRHNSDGFDFCADVHCQVYKGLLAETKKTTRAVLATEGEVLTSDGVLIEPFYHSNSGGCVHSDVWGERAYLDTKFDFSCGPKDIAAPDELSLSARLDWFLGFVPKSCGYKDKSNFRWQRAYDAEDYSMIFGEKIPTTRDLKIMKETGCYRVTDMEISSLLGKKKIHGGLKIRQYFDGLKSNAFFFYSQTKGNAPMLVFWGAGFGHGGGMSQEGAIGMAEQGYSYRQILKEYYPGAKTTSSE